MNLEHFYLNRYRLTLTARDELHLPAYKGTTLRGGFGLMFRRLVCYQPEVPTCHDCLLRFTCPYPVLFDTYPPPDAPVLKNLQDVPIPLIIEPPEEPTRYYAPGESLTFHVVLVGEAKRYLSYLAVAFQELGRQGLGRSRGRFVLQRIEAVHPYTGETAEVYDRSRPAIIRVATLPVYFSECAERANSLTPSGVQMTFLTPTRLKDNNRIVEEPPSFQIVWRSLMRRVSALSYFHCQRQWEADYKGLAAAAREVQLIDPQTRWATFKRYSTRQEQTIPISGLVGTATYVGDLTPFLPVLVLGEWTHVGKATVMGNGRYTLHSLPGPLYK